MKNKKAHYLALLIIAISVALLSLIIFQKLPGFINSSNCPATGANPVASSSILEWFQKPAAVRFVKKYDRTYISWVTSDGKIQMRYYDHNARNFSGIYTIDDLYPDFGIEARDDHNAPSLLILPDGHILIFYAVHDENNALFMKKSINSENISSWSPRIDISDEATNVPYNYPQAKRLENGNILLFYRRGNFYNSDEYFKVSKDNGRKWGSPTKIIDFGNDGIYPFIYEKDDYIHIAWNKSVSDNPPRKNVYYMYSADGGQRWKKKDGTLLTLPIKEENADIVFHSGNDPAYVWDIVVDDKQNPFIVFAHKHDPFHEFIFSGWTGVEWNNYVITNSAKLYSNGNFYSGGIVIDPKNVFNVFLSKKRGRLEIERWTSSDKGKTWKKVEALTEGSSVDNFRPQLVENYSDNFRLIWSSGLYEGLVENQWTGFTKVNIQSELTKNSIPPNECL